MENTKEIQEGFNHKKGIKCADGFNDYATEIFEKFLEGFTKENKLIRDVEEDDMADEEIVFMYTNKGMKLADRMKGKLLKVGSKYFPDDDIDIITNMFQDI
jgi:hypothetical protein